MSNQTEEKQVFVLGATNIDFKMDNLPKWPEKGGLIVSPHFTVDAGGKANGQACALAKLKIPTYLISCIGKTPPPKEEKKDEQDKNNKDNPNAKRVDDYDLIDIAKVSDWENLKLKTQHVTQKEGKTGVTMIIVEGGQNSIIEYMGNNNKIEEREINNALDQANEGDFFLTTLEAIEGIDEKDPRSKLVENALKKAKERGMTTILSPAPHHKFDRFDLVDYFIVYKKELKTLTGEDFDKNKPLEDEIYKHYKILKEKCKKDDITLIVCLGAEEGCAFYKRMYSRMRAPKGPKEKDSTMCRGAFIGGFISQIAKGKSIEDALEYANYAMSYCSNIVGAISALPSDEDVREWMKKYPNHK